MRLVILVGLLVACGNNVTYFPPVPDMAQSPRDLGPRDFTVVSYPDMSTAPADMTTPVQSYPDLAVTPPPPDMTVVPQPPDMTQLPDLKPPPDLRPPPDMVPMCTPFLASCTYGSPACCTGVCWNGKFGTESGPERCCYQTGINCQNDGQCCRGWCNQGQCN